MFRSRLLYPEKSLPLLLEAEENSVAGGSVSCLIEWITCNRELFESWLTKHGAVLLRHFAIDTLEEFEAVVRAVQPALQHYIGGDSPRTKITGKVYTSTDYPEAFQLSLHNELSYAHKWPSKIFFYCALPPAQGGETPIVDCREVLKNLDPQLCDKFISRKVRYASNLHGGEGVGRSWQDTFETDDKARVEKYLGAGGVDFKWNDRYGLRTSQIREAIITHPVTGEEVWFNQAEQWHPSMLDPKDRRALKALGMKEEDLPHYTSFGDGGPLDEQELNEIRTVKRERAVHFP